MGKRGSEREPVSPGWLNWIPRDIGTSACLTEGPRPDGRFKAGIIDFVLKIGESPFKSLPLKTEVIIISELKVLSDVSGHIRDLV